MRTPNLSILVSNPLVPSISDGLIHDAWSNTSVGKYNNGNGVTPSTMETNIDNIVSSGKTPTTSDILTDASIPSINSGTASLTHGLIYLSAGTAYTFSGTGDDSFLLEIGGATIATATWNGGNNSFSGSVKPSVSGWYTVDIYHDNENGPGNFDVNVPVNGGATVDMNTTNFQLVQNVQDLDSSGVRTSGLQGSSTSEPHDGYYTVLSNNEGHVGTWIPLSNITTSLTNAADHLTSLQLEKLAANTQVTDGTHWAVADSNGNVDITGWTTTSLNVLVPVDYTGSVVNAEIDATATNSLNGLTSTTTQNLPITIDSYTTLSGTTVVGTDADEKLVGTSGNDTLNGGGGHDLLSGGAGNDTLIGGLGNDILIGGLGHDIFKWTSSDVGTSNSHQSDTIMDFSTTQGDQLDLKDVLHTTST